MNPLDKLIQHFERFPGVGGRQARRFAFHLLTQDKNTNAELAELITTIQGSVIECPRCHRFSTYTGTEHECAICTDPNRDHTKLMVVERDIDVQSVEHSGVYDGLYFVLGGTAPLLESKETGKLRAGSLKRLVETQLPELSEIILAFSVNPDGENTARFINTVLKEIPGFDTVTVTEMGRGLSTGSELEYADPETIKNALQNRH